MRHRLEKSVCRIVKIVGAFGLSLAILAGCSILKGKQQAVDEPSIKTVKAEKVTKQKIADAIEVSGIIQSSVQRDINSPFGGEVIEVLKKRGDFIEEGEVIARLHSKSAIEERDQAVLAVNNAKAAIYKAVKNQEETRKQLANDIRKMEIELEDLTKKYNVLRNRFDAGAVTKRQVEDARIQLEKYQMDVEEAKQNQNSVQEKDSISALELQLANSNLKLEKAEEALAGLVVKSPISGIITELPIMGGMTIQSGAKISKIEKVNPLKIKASLNETSAILVRGRTELTFYKPGADQKLVGNISYLANDMNPDTKTYELNLDSPNEDNALRPGMSVRVKLTSEAEQMVIGIPQQSVVTEGENHFGFVLVGDAVEKRQVQLGRSNDQYYEALSGVHEGDLIVISGQTKLKDKEKVQYTIVEASQ